MKKFTGSMLLFLTLSTKVYGNLTPSQKIVLADYMGIQLDCLTDERVVNVGISKIRENLAQFDSDGDDPLKLQEKSRLLGVRALCGEHSTNQMLDKLKEVLLSELKRLPRRLGLNHFFDKAKESSRKENESDFMMDFMHWRATSFLQLLHYAPGNLNLKRISFLKINRLIDRLAPGVLSALTEAKDPDLHEKDSPHLEPMPITTSDSSRGEKCLGLDTTFVRNLRRVTL